jgi:mannosyltransferase
MKKIITRITEFFRAHPRADLVLVVTALALFAGLALWNISGPSIWFDEAFSAYLINFNFIDIARYTATDVHPPFFYWMLKAWVSVFGSTELGLRSMSVFFGAVTAVFGYLIVRRKFGRRAATVGLFILAISPFFIRYSQEARMYTLVAAIVFSATYVLIRALESKSRKLWITYGVLVSLGMWTHYFVALAWLAHWAWRYIITRHTGVRGKVLARKFFDKNWILAHIVAIGLFVPWIPAMAIQLVIVQVGGFWIGPVGVDTVTGYFGSIVYFWEHDHVTGWFAAALAAMSVVVVTLMLRVYKKGNKDFKKHYLLFLCLAAIPPILLFMASLPPLTSSFVERYILPAIVASAFLIGITLVYGLQGTRIWKQVLVYVTVVAMLVFGLANMYDYGNYNKNSRTDIQTKQLVTQVIEKSDPGEPIIVSSPWVFYEAIFYNSEEHPIYFIDANTEYEFGSLDMLKYSDQHKINDLTAFTNEHPTVWYIGYFDEEVKAPVANWVQIDESSVTSRLDGKTVYRGAEFIVPAQ